ncbi:hypothetical protein VTL71DRAFT_55 [Oculimacula yallundae]|uniref:J domain-containing protein n=1 Tax=Oculimacula yallundae TaxID=86028 RepID=A0ABR4D0G4_9HELO
MAHLHPQIPNHYLTLQIPPTASTSLIKSAYKTLALTHHPDKNPLSDKQNATDKFQKITAAFEVLGDEIKRREYDVVWREEFRGWEWEWEGRFGEGEMGKKGWEGKREMDLREVDANGFRYQGVGRRGYALNTYRPKTKAWRKRERELREGKSATASTPPSSYNEESGSGDEKDDFEAGVKTAESGTFEDDIEELENYGMDTMIRNPSTRNIQLDHDAYLVDCDLPLYTGRKFCAEDDPEREAGDEFVPEHAEPSVKHGYEDRPVDGPGKDKTRKAGTVSPLEEIEQLLQEKKEAREREKEEFEHGEWESAFVSWGKLQEDFDTVMRERGERKQANLLGMKERLRIVEGVNIEEEEEGEIGEDALAEIEKVERDRCLEAALAFSRMRGEEYAEQELRAWMNRGYDTEKEAERRARKVAAREAEIVDVETKWWYVANSISERVEHKEAKKKSKERKKEDPTTPMLFGEKRSKAKMAKESKKQEALDKFVQAEKEEARIRKEEQNLLFKKVVEAATMRKKMDKKMKKENRGRR